MYIFYSAMKGICKMNKFSKIGRYRPHASSGCNRKNSILIGNWQGRSGIISEQTDELKCIVEKVQLASM